MRLLRYSPRTMHEAASRLLSKGFDRRAVDEAVQRAMDAGLIDDRLFAKLWVEDRVVRRPLSRRAVQYELADRGVASDVIARALADGYPPEREPEVAERVAGERYARDRSSDPERRRRRVVDHLVRRGFSISLAVAAVKRAEEAAIDDD